MSQCGDAVTQESSSPSCTEIDDQSGRCVEPFTTVQIGCGVNLDQRSASPAMVSRWALRIRSELDRMAASKTASRYMSFGEGGLAAAFTVLAFVAIVVAAKAYTVEYAFHLHLQKAPSQRMRFPTFPGMTLSLCREYACYLVPLAPLLGLTGLAGFLRTLKSGQYDDLDGAALRILADDNVADGQ